MSTIASIDDEYQPTRLEDVKWRVGNRINLTAVRAYDRVTSFADRLTGDSHVTLAEQERRNYEWGYKVATQKFASLLVASRNGGDNR